MKQKYLFLIILVTALLVAGVIIIFSNKEYYDDENTLYSINFDKIKLRFERYDYSLGQNQIVGVEKSTNKGKTYEKITDEPIIVSMEPKFIFLNEELGFAIAKQDLSKNNNYRGVKVTNDGGKTFNDGIINYENPNIEIITIEDVPYYENNILKLKCSIYQINENRNGYDDVEIVFISGDRGLTWNLEE